MPKDLRKKLAGLISNGDQAEIVRKGGVYIVLRVLGLLLGYLFTLIVTRQFGSASYGLVVLSLTLFMIVSIGGKLGFDIPLTRFVASGKYSKEQVGAFLAKASLRSFSISVLLAYLVIAGRHWIASNVFDNAELAPYLVWTALTFPFWSQILLHIGLYRGLRKNTLFSFYNAFGRFFLAVVLLLLALQFWEPMTGVTVVMLHFIAVALLYLSCCWITYVNLRYPVWSRAEIDWILFQDTARPILITSMIFILLSWIDRFFVGYYLDEEAVAIYDVAAKLALLVSFNLDAINSILAPKVVALYQKKEAADLQKTISFSVRLSALIAGATFLGILLGHPFLLAFFGEEYRAGAWVLIILASGQLANCLSGSVGILLQMTGHQLMYQRIMIAGLLVNIALNIFLAPIFGIEGIAFATFASILTWNFLGIYYCKRKLGVTSHLNLARSKRRTQK